MKVSATKRLVDRAYTWAVFKNSAGVIFESTLLDVTPNQFTTHLTRHSTRSIEDLVPEAHKNVFKYPSRMIVFENLTDTTKFLKTKYSKESKKTFSLLKYNNLIYIDPSLPPAQLLSHSVMHRNLFFNCFRKPLAFTHTLSGRGSPSNSPPAPAAPTITEKLDNVAPTP